MLRVVTYLGLGNFLAFIVIDIMLGGDALSGHVLNGHYYLGNHGIYTQVSRIVFIYSECHAYSALIGLALAFAAARRWKQLNPDKVR